MTDEQIIRARVLMAEQGIRADDLTDEQVAGLVKSLGSIHVVKMKQLFGRELSYPVGDFDSSLLPMIDEPGLTPVPPPPS